MKILVKHSNIDMRTKVDKMAEGETTLPRMECRLPEEAVIDLLNDTIRDNGGFRKGLGVVHIMETLDKECSGPSDADTMGTMTGINLYLSEVPDHFNIRHVDMNADGLLLEVKLNEDPI